MLTKESLRTITGVTAIYYTLIFEPILISIGYAFYQHRNLSGVGAKRCEYNQRLVSDK